MRLNCCARPFSNHCAVHLDSLTLKKKKKKNLFKCRFNEYHMDVSFVISHWGIPKIISATETLEQNQTSSYELDF